MEEERFYLSERERISPAGGVFWVWGGEVGGGGVLCFPPKGGLW